MKQHNMDIHTFGFHHAIRSLTREQNDPWMKLQPTYNFFGKCNESIKHFNSFILYRVYCKNYASSETARWVKIHYFILFTKFFV
jgi:hypothetical protein